MAGPPLTRRKDAHYHALVATEQWRAFVQAMQAQARRPVGAREAQDAQRRRETTYAHGELGGS